MLNISSGLNRHHGEARRAAFLPSSLIIRSGSIIGIGVIRRALMSAVTLIS